MEVKIVGANLCVRLSELLFDKISFVVNIYFLDGTQEQVKSADNCILEIGLDYLSITPPNVKAYLPDMRTWRIRFWTLPASFPSLASDQLNSSSEKSLHETSGEPHSLWLGIRARCAHGKRVTR
jgi:hypothetical protein